MRNILTLLLLVFSTLFATGFLRTDHTLSIESASNENAETLADHFFRYHVLRPAEQSASINEVAYEENYQHLTWLWGRVSTECLQSPFDIIIHYGDAFKSSIIDMECQKVKDASAYKNITSINSYLKKTIDEIRVRYANGYTPVLYTFADTQERAFLEKTTLGGETLRVCGLTPNIESHILTHLNQLLLDHAIKPLKIYYFGSRVMPRSEVVKRDASLINLMPINAKGFNKNAVRVKGLTQISDLEMMVVFSADYSVSGDELKAIKQQFRIEFSKVFREFPVSVKLIQSDDSDIEKESFNFIQRKYEEGHHKHLSSHQFVEADF